MSFFKHLILPAALCLAAGSANAALRMCNETAFVQSVTMGYEGDQGWMSKGWWNIDPNDCAVVVGGELQQRFYYYRAEVNGGDFPGEGYMFCTTPQEFEIIGDENCESRGYHAESFAEIDTGAEALDFTFTLEGDGSAPPPRNDDGPGNDNDTSDPGLHICNNTRDVQSVSIGYEGDEGFKSEGWWNIDPDDCAFVLSGNLQQRYYYWRAEVNAGPFEGEGFMFCTSPQVFEIIGDTNCEARGYDTESFSEIDVGPTALTYTLYIDDDGNSAPPPQNDTPPPSNTNGNGGIEVCNEGEGWQAIAFGYEGPEDWTSEGWWNVDPGECVVPALDGVNRRYLFYTTIGDFVEFEGDGYFFCSSPQAFVVVGDSNCEARGYERSDFIEVDTGSTTEMYTLVLDDRSGGGGKSQDNTGGKDTDVDNTPVFDDDSNNGGSRLDDDSSPDTPTFDFGLPDEDTAPDTDTTPVTPDTDTVPDTTPTPDVIPDTTPDTTPVPDDTPSVPTVDDPPAEEDGPRVPPRRGGSRGG